MTHICAICCDCGSPLWERAAKAKEDYQTLYKALQVRCSQVADRLRCVSALPADHRAAMPPNYLDGLADTLDTPISTQQAAELLHLDRSEAK